MSVFLCVGTMKRTLPPLAFIILLTVPVLGAIIMFSPFYGWKTETQNTRWRKSFHFVSEGKRAHRSRSRDFSGVEPGLKRGAFVGGRLCQPTTSTAEPCHNLLWIFTADIERTLVVFSSHLLSTFSQYINCLTLQILMLMSLSVLYGCSKYFS